MPQVFEKDERSKERKISSVIQLFRISKKTHSLIINYKGSITHLVINKNN
jgi:hypothetical protein